MWAKKVQIRVKFFETLVAKSTLNVMTTTGTTSRVLRLEDKVLLLVKIGIAMVVVNSFKILCFKSSKDVGYMNAIPFSSLSSFSRSPFSLPLFPPLFFFGRLDNFNSIHKLGGLKTETTLSLNISLSLANTLTHTLSLTQTHTEIHARALTHALPNTNLGNAAFFLA